MHDLYKVVLFIHGRVMLGIFRVVIDAVAHVRSDLHRQPGYLPGTWQQLLKMLKTEQCASHPAVTTARSYKVPTLLLKLYLI